VEITVTAERRSQSMQDVPISMQAFTAQTLEQLNVSTLDDYIKYLPNVSTANNGPGQNEIFMRGLSAGSQPSQGSGSTGLWPNVAIYLDNQSGQLPNRNLDIYTADLNRIEILAGPQGTLYGAGAEAGVIRYITNQPRLDTFEANFKAGYGVTASGDPNSDITGVINFPLIAEKMAARGELQRYARRLQRQRTGDLHPQEHRHRHPLRQLPGRERRLPGWPAEQRLLRTARERADHQRRREREQHQSGHLHGRARGVALQVQ
jgi:outer membrane receptor for ferrienterochelin and colicin